MARPKRTLAAGSRERVFAAAATAFAAHGFAGTSVDRIADAARLNKAMIYYHFKSKGDLYREILSDMFQAVRAGVLQAASSDGAPDAKIRGYIDAIATAAEARPHFPPIWLREIAEGGEHIDAATIANVRDVLASLGRIIEEGHRGGRFRRIDPLLLQAGIIAPLMFFFATARLRRKMERAGAPGLSHLTRAMVVDHLQRITLAQLEGKL